MDTGKEAANELASAHGLYRMGDSDREDGKNRGNDYSKTQVPSQQDNSAQDKKICMHEGVF
jgi:hypothetical protein